MLRVRPSLICLACLGALAGCYGKSKLTSSGVPGQNPDGTNVPGASDEGFPSALLEPFTGPAVNYYDNTFINFPQLKGKVKAVFNDDWVRDGGDQFEANIALFGGVDFQTNFVEARVATSDFLLGLDALSKDVCGQAVANGTGPFTGVDTGASVVDAPASQSKTFSAINTADMVPSPGSGDVEGAVYDLYTNGTLSTAQPYSFPAAGSYTFTVRAHGSLCQNAGPNMDLQVGGTVLTTFSNLGTSDQNYTFTANVNGGPQVIAVAFTNDASDSTGDRNLYVTSLTVAGPNGSGGGGTANQTAARAVIDKVYRAMLYRAPAASEESDAYALVSDLVNLGTSTPSAWSGLCEALIRHPDFLFTLPPSTPTTRGAARNELLLVKIAQDLVARPPSGPELEQLAAGTSLDQMASQYLSSTEFRDYFFYKMRIRTESDGTPDADEPARLWTYLVTQHQPFEQLLDGDYSVDANFNKVARDPIHGSTGVLTMKGYLLHKQGLPHYNYSARVLQDFMGYVFEVPESVIAMRLGATAASTVDPNSICYTCHHLLTPLAYQRKRWDDQGNYSAVDASGQPIDDSDRNLAPDYPFKGEGMGAFASQAVKKEKFVRHTIDAVYTLLLGRPMRADDDERVIYKQLWDAQASANGDLQAVFKTIIDSPTYQGP